LITLFKGCLHFKSWWGREPRWWCFITKAAKY